MKLDNMIDALSAVTAPGKAEHDCSQMTLSQIDEAILNLVVALGDFCSLLEILEHATFEDGDKQKAEHLASLVTERIGWAISVLSAFPTLQVVN
jgi:hypothetical protein